MPRWPILWLTPASCTSLRAPRLPSSLTRNFGTTNRLMPLTPGGPAGNLRQHHVHDVFRQFVVAAGDPHLLADQAIAAVAGGFGARADVGQRGTCLGFAQAHGAEESALQDRLPIQALLLGRAAGAEAGWPRRAPAMRSRWWTTLAARNIASLKQRQRVRQLQSALGLVGEQRGEARFGIGIQRLLHFRDDLNAAVEQMRLVQVGGAVVRREFFQRQAVRQVDDALESVQAMRGEARIRQQRGERPQLFGYEAQLRGERSGEMSSLAPD